MNQQQKSSDLRQKAIDLLASREPDLASGLATLSPEETLRMIHDLQVHRLELELQNEELRLAQQELDQAKRRYFDLYELSPMGFCLVSESGLILDANLTTANMLEQDRSRLIGYMLSDFIHHDDHEMFYEHRKRTVRTGHGQACEMRMLRRDGSFFWAYVNCTLAYGDEDELVGHVGIIDISERKYAEETLISRNAFFEAIADSPIDGVLVVDSLGNKVHQNQRLIDLWSIPPDIAANPCDRNQVQFVRSQTQDPEKFVAGVEALYANPEATAREEIELINGTILERYTAPVIGKNGEYFGRIWTFRDITERKAAEAAHADSINRLKKVASRTPGFVYQFRKRIDGTFSFPYVSERIFDLCHVRPEDALEDAYIALKNIHPFDNDFLDSINESAERLTPWSREFRYVLSDGSLRWLSGNSIPEREADGSTLWHGYICDITAERVAADELREAKNLLEEAQSLTRMGNWTYDLATGRNTWSKQHFLLFGVNHENGELGYHAALALFEPEDAKAIDEAVNHAISTGDPYSLTVRFRKCDHGVKYVKCEGRVRYDASGNVVGLYGTSIDVTAEVEREEALHAARIQAEVANRVKSEFLANMSHEIRTPLTAILGFADILRDEKEHAFTDQQRRQTIDTITNAGNHLLAIINDVLDISKIEADKIVVENIEMSVPQILHDVESLLRPRATGKGLRFRSKLVTDIPEFVICDPTRLRQILMNLVGNATKFTEEGFVTMSAGVLQSENKAMLFIDVEDTGLGMTVEQAEMLFQPFRQADSTVTRSHGGTGLGLTISRRLANLMGGNVLLKHTELGKGTCFRVVLPLVPAGQSKIISQLHEASVPEEQNTSLQNVQLNGRILLAEDGIDNQKLIAFHLRRAGAVVDIANNGRVALDLIERASTSGAHYDLLLTDIQMPEMDGYALTKTLRARGSSLPIVALTAHAMAEDRQKGIDVGCDDYISKPIEKTTLLVVCSKHLKS